MKYEVATAEKSTVKITFTFTNEEWAAAGDKAYRENRAKYAVNGFRKGKVPRHILELYYGAGLFFEDSLNILIQEHYFEVIGKEEEHFTVVGDPSFALGENFSEDNVVLVATVPVKPEATIEKYEGIKIRKFVYTVSDADVEADILATRERIAENEDVTDRPAAEKDIVNIDFEGKVNGVAFEGGTAKGYDLTLGSGQFIPGFEEQVVGMSVGETKDVNVTFPEDYQSEELKGKPATFTVTVHKITAKKLPELDEAFAKKMGSDSVEEYRAKVRERLERRAAQRSLNETENSILEAIAEGASAEIPDAMIDQQEEKAMQRMETNLMYQGIKLDDYLRYVGSTREEYKKNYEEQAKKEVLHQLIIEKIVKDRGITASEEEVSERVGTQAKELGKDPAEYRKTMDPRQIDYIASDIVLTKLFDYLQEHNEMYTEEPAPAAPASEKKTAKKSAKKSGTEENK